MDRKITGFHQDEEGHWVAELNCGHGQHVRHQPPFFERHWTVNKAERDSKVGCVLNCIRCDEFEMPDGFRAYTQTRVFDQDTIPQGLRKSHQTKVGVWARIHCLQGRLKYVVESPLNCSFELNPDLQGIVLPEVLHRIEPLGMVQVFVEFYRQHPRE